MFNLQYTSKYNNLLTKYIKRTKQITYRVFLYEYHRNPPVLIPQK